jgi:hypothetical protein
MVDKEEGSIAEQRIGNQVPVTTNNYERAVMRLQVAENVFRDNTFVQNKNRKLGGSDFYSGHVVDIKGS